MSEIVSIAGGAAIAAIAAAMLAAIFSDRRKRAGPIFAAANKPECGWLIPIVVAVCAVLAGQLIGAGVLWLAFGQACR